MIDLPPGLLFISSGILRASTVLGCIYALCFFARNQLNLAIPIWLSIALAIFSFPIIFVLSILWKDFKNNSDARALGAVLVPLVPSKQLGGIDLFTKMTKNITSGYLGEVSRKWMEDLGYTVGMRVMFETRITTTEPEYIKIVLSTSFDNYEKGSVFRSTFESLFGTGVFNSDGDMWKFHRSMSRPFFTREKISHFDTFDRHAEDIINQIRDRLREGIAVDVQDAFCRFTLDSASEFLFGLDVRSSSAGLPYPQTVCSAQNTESHPANKYSNAFMAAQVAASIRPLLNKFWPLTEIWEDKVKKQMRIVYDFVDPVVKAALEKKRLNASIPDDEENVTLLDDLVKQTDDPVIIRDAALNIMVAGRDTTAAAITYAVYCLAENPDVLKRLRQEILENVGNRTPLPEDLRNMRYLRAVINETLRLYPPVPFNSRWSIKPTVWPSLNGGKPWYVPAGTRIQYSVYLMHRREDLWGPDALEFDPDRFLDDRVKKYLIANPFSFLPFNAGPRICLGQQFAYNEISFMLIRLLQTFKNITVDLDAHPDARPPAAWANGSGRQAKEKVWLKSHITTFAKNGLWVKMEEASKE